MKRFVFIMATVVVCCAGLFVACDREPEMPTELNAQTAKQVILWYFPYDGDDVYAFRNNKTGEVWEIIPKIAPKDDTDNFPKVIIDDTREWGGEWLLSVNAQFVKKGTDLNNYNGRNAAAITCNILPRKDSISLQWANSICFTGNVKDTYFADMSFRTDTGEVFSLFTDTITIPFYKRGASIPSNTYMQIVRHKGLTAFSIDGESVWKRK